MLLTDERTIQLLAIGSYGAIVELRNLVLNIFNHELFPNVSVLRLTRCLDAEHKELFHDIIEHAESEWGFTYINNVVAPIILRDMERYE